LQLIEQQVTQMEYAALNTQILPLRLQAAQMRAINAAVEKVKK
jgi:hypothetical protein